MSGDAFELQIRVGGVGVEYKGSRTSMMIAERLKDAYFVSFPPPRTRVLQERREANKT